MATLAELLNAPTDFEWDGKVYKLREPTLDECAEYCQWLKAEARCAAIGATDIPDPEMQRNLFRDVVKDIAAQVYSWGGEVCIASLRTPQGIAKLISITCADQGVTPKVAEQMAAKRLRDLAEIVVGLMEEDPTGKKLQAVARLMALPLSFLGTSSSASATPRTEHPPTSSGSES